MPNGSMVFLGTTSRSALYRGDDLWDVPTRHWPAEIPKESGGLSARAFQADSADPSSQ